MAEIKLNIYNGRKIEKTYVTEDVFIMWGTLEDVLDAIDLNIFADVAESSNSDLILAVAKILAMKDNTLKPLIKDVFEGLTDDEIRRTRVTDLAKVFIAIVKYNIEQLDLFNTGSNSKN